FRATAEDEIAEFLRKDWNDLIDPLIELRVRMFLGEDTGQKEIVGYFGRGIFAPRRNERPLGRIEIARLGAVSSDQPVLPGRNPAGFYRGQSALSGYDLQASGCSRLSRIILRSRRPSASIGTRQWQSPT